MCLVIGILTRYQNQNLLSDALLIIYCELKSSRSLNLNTERQKTYQVNFFYSANMGCLIMVSPLRHFWVLLAILSVDISIVLGKEKEAPSLEGTVLGANRSDADHYGLRRSFRCPGKGNYPVPAAGNCAKFFECKKKGRRPLTLKECPGKDQNFHRLSRTCVKAEYVKCKWCRKEGLHTDRTSEKHFISCLPGRVASRYKCNKGKFDPFWRKCSKTSGAIFNIDDDAEEDGPEDIVKFMKEWIEDEQDDEPVKKKKHKKKSDDSNEDEDSEKKKARSFGWAMAMNMPMPMMPPMPGLPPPPPPPPLPPPSSKKSKHTNSIELSDSSEERKRKQGPFSNDDESGSEEQVSKEKKKKKKKSDDD